MIRTPYFVKLPLAFPRGTHGQRSVSSHRASLQVPAHVAAFALLLLPAMAFYAYYETHKPTEDDMRQTLQEKYDKEIQQVSAKNKNVAEFLRHAMKHDDGAVDSQIDQVLKAGKGGKKRLYAVDEKLYGTAEGVAERKRVEDEQLEQLKSKKKLKRKKKAVNDEAATPTVPNESTKQSPVSATTVGAVTFLACAVATAAGYWISGSRRS